MLSSFLSTFSNDAYCYKNLVVNQIFVSVPLLLYSHIPPAIITIIVGIFLTRNNKTLEAKIFFYLALSFFLFALGDLTEWFVFLGRHWVMFARSFIEILDPVLFILASYFLYVLVKRKDIGQIFKVIWLIPLALLILRVVLNQNLIGYNWQLCEAVESTFSAKYIYCLDLFYAISAGLFAVWSIISNQNRRKEVALASVGVCSFIALFFVMEYVFTGYIFEGVFDYNYFLYSFFGMPILIAFLAYLTITFHTFHIKLITVQILVWGAIALVFSQFFFLSDKTSLVLNIVTIILVAALGNLIIRNVRKEIEQREKIEQLAKTLEVANKDLKELDRQKDELISIVSHQLATPVTSVKYYIEMFLDGDMGQLTPEQKDSILTMGKVTGDLSDLVSMILDVSRIQLGRMKVTRTELDFLGYVKEILTVIEPKAKQKKIELDIAMPTSLEPMMLDKRLVRMTLENLLTNAVKYTPDGGKVILSVEKRDRTLHYEVRDTGYGIPKAEQGKIFGKLFRASNVVDKMDGNGFGLFAAKGAVEAQGGKIWFESEEHKGTTFFVDLPILLKGEQSDADAVAKNPPVAA